MWTNERRENRSALERVTHELATMKKEYGIVIEKLKRELVEERKKSKHQFHRQRSKTHTDQVSNCMQWNFRLNWPELSISLLSKVLHEFLDRQCRSLVIDRSPFVRLRRCDRQALLTLSFKFVYTRRIGALKGERALVMKNGIQFSKLIPSLPPRPSLPSLENGSPCARSTAGKRCLDFRLCKIWKKKSEQL